MKVMTMINLEENYEKFKPIVEQIRSNFSTTEYIGNGAESEVWRAEVDGAAFAVKALRQFSPGGVRRDTAQAVRDKIDAGRRGEGIDGLEQIYAASIQDGVVVYNYVKSGILNAYDVTDDQLNSLVDTVTKATTAGIEIDGQNRGGNTIYSPESGFTLIDYWAAPKEVSLRTNICHALGSLGGRGIAIGKRLDTAESLDIPRIVDNDRLIVANNYRR